MTAEASSTRSDRVRPWLRAVVSLGLATLAASMAFPNVTLAEGAADAALHRLVAAYPDFLERIEGELLVWKDGTRMAIDDGKGAKPAAQAIEAADIKDMFRWRYPAKAAIAAPAFEEDPGRTRHQPLFDKMYGDCIKGEVERHLVPIVWLPKKGKQTLKVSRINGVDTRLAAVSRELDELPPSFDAFLVPAAGTFNCRPIAGTTRPSVHGYGIAIDIAVKPSHYWRWSKPGPNGGYTFQNRIPAEIVQIFEKHGFIWGGRWYHFDTMHFEYRPELIGPE